MANKIKRRERETARLRQQSYTIKRFRQEKRNRKNMLHSLIQMQMLYGNSAEAYLRKNKQYTNKLIREFTDIQNEFLKLSSGDKAFFMELMQHPKINFDKNKHYYRLLIAFIQHFEFPIREFSSWKTPRSNSEEVIMQSLFTHLYVAYKLPRVLVRKIPAILNKNLKEWEGKLLLALAEGKGLHTLKTMPIDCNSKMNYFFTRAPEDYTLLEAFAWAKLKSSKAGERFSSILARKLFKNPEQKWPKWIAEFMGFIQRNSDISGKEINDILSFIVFQKETKYQIALPGVSYKIKLDPLFPNFSFKGKTIASAMRDVSEWKKYLLLSKQMGEIGSLPVSTTKAFTHRTTSQKCYSFKQILTVKELTLEGKKMKHCVACYVDECLDKSSSIWSVQVRFSNGKTKSVLTIELEEEDKSLAQVRGLSNRDASQEEMTAVKAWAEKESLKINLD